MNEASQVPLKVTFVSCWIKLMIFLNDHNFLIMVFFETIEDFEVLKKCHESFQVARKINIFDRGKHWTSYKWVMNPFELNVDIFLWNETV